MADPTFDVGAAPQGADWDAIRDAFFDWIAAATGVTPSSIAWVNQGVNRPAGVVVSLSIAALAEVGLDAHAHTYDETAEMNQELTHSVFGDRIGTLRVQHFAGDASGMLSSFAALSRSMTALRLQTRRDAFRAAGIGILSAGPVQDISAPLALQIEPRATLDVRFAVRDWAAEKGGYIASAPVNAKVYPSATFQFDSGPGLDYGHLA